MACAGKADCQVSFKMGRYKMMHGYIEFVHCISILGLEVKQVELMLKNDVFFLGLLTCLSGNKLNKLLG